MALRLKDYRAKPSKILIPSFHKVSIPCIRGSRKTSISMSGCLGLYIWTDSKRYFLFWHNHVGRLYIVSITGHALWVLLLSPNGFIPSVHNVNRTFLGSFPNSRQYLSSNSFHYRASAICRSFSSPFLHLSESHHRISSKFFWVREQTPKAIGN